MLFRSIGDTYTGPGGTLYNLSIDPATGKPAFSTSGVSTSNVGDLSAILSVLQFVPGAAPFAMAANAALAASQGNTIGALASLTGIPGVSDALNPTLVGALQTANQVSNLANAVQTGNWLGALSSASSLSGAGLGNTQLGDTGFTVNDAMRIGNIVNAVNKGDVGALTRAISTYAKSQNQTGGITNRILDETILDAGVKAFVDSKRAGASDEDAMDASKFATGGVEVPGLADLQNILKTAYAGSGTQLAAADTGTVTDAGGGGPELTITAPKWVSLAEDEEVTGSKTREDGSKSYTVTRTNPDNPDDKLTYEVIKDAETGDVYYEWGGVSVNEEGQVVGGGGTTASGAKPSWTWDTKKGDVASTATGEPTDIVDVINKNGEKTDIVATGTGIGVGTGTGQGTSTSVRSEEHTSELQSH